MGKTIAKTQYQGREIGKYKRIFRSSINNKNVKYYIMLKIRKQILNLSWYYYIVKNNSK